MSEAQQSPLSHDSVGDLAAEVLTDLYRAVCGHLPKAVRAYRDDDALLLLLRFDRDEIDDGSPIDDGGPLLDAALIAMPGLIASAVEARGGYEISPGNVSVSAERGLAVFAFSAGDEALDQNSDDDLFSLDASSPASAAANARRALRLAS